MMSLVVKDGWSGLSLGIGTNGPEMRIYEFKLTLINNRKHQCLDKMEWS